jgi:hypothetical protein
MTEQSETAVWRPTGEAAIFAGVVACVFAFVAGLAGQAYASLAISTVAMVLVLSGTYDSQ